MSDCQVEGNPDLYGIGVRAGLYAQWVATLLATLFDPKTESTYRLANLIIQASIFIGLCTQSGEGFPIVGAVITQYLLFGSLSSLTGDGVSHFEHVSGILRILFYIAVSGYGCWFWFKGVDIMSTPDCSDIVFFNEITADGGFRTFGKIASAGGIVICFGALIYSIYRVCIRFKDGFQEGFQRKEKVRPQVELSLLVLSMALIGISIYLIEHLLMINQVQGVGVDKITAVGQLIPLLAGGLACFMTTWKILVHRLFLRKRCWFIFGYHL